MQLGLTENLPALVARRFTTAKEAGHLVFSSTHLSIITTSGIPYQLRYCPALAKKPTNLKPTETPKPKPDPFQDPSPELLIASFPPRHPSHNLVLNKFPVIPNHFILATTNWKSQTDLLEVDDLQAAFECLRAWSDSRETSETGGDGLSTSGSSSSQGRVKRRLFAFFNSGDESGASQPHRHLQFLPIEAMRDESGAWEPLIDLVEDSHHSHHSHHSDVTFRYIPNLHIKHFALPIPPNPSPDHLHKTYLSLYTEAVSSVTHSKNETVQEIPTSGAARISYNLAMTTSTMLLCPRKSETASVPIDSEKTRDIVDPGVLSLNGTILAGTLMVKAEGEWDALRAEPGLLGRVLGHVGFLREDRDREGGALL